MNPWENVRPTRWINSRALDEAIAEIETAAKVLRMIPDMKTLGVEGQASLAYNTLSNLGKSIMGVDEFHTFGHLAGIVENPTQSDCE
jgi:hypothetical protein